MKKVFYLLLIIFYTNDQYVLGMEADDFQDDQTLPILANNIKKIKALGRALDSIIDALLVNCNKFTKNELNQINNFYSEYKKESQNYLNFLTDNSECIILIQKSLVLITNYDQLACKKNILIDSNIMKDVNKIRTDFLNKNGALIEDVFENDEQNDFYHPFDNNNNEEEKNVKLAHLKNLLLPLNTAVHEIKNILLSHDKLLSDDQSKQIKSLFDAYINNVKTCTDNAAAYALLISDALSFIRKGHVIAAENHIFINPDYINSITKIRAAFIDINGSLMEVEDKDNKDINHHNTIKEKNPAKESQKKIFTDTISNHFSKSIFSNHNQFCLPSWNDFKIWKFESLKANASLSNDLQPLIDRYLYNKAESIITMKREVYDLFIQKITSLLYNFPNFAVNLNFVRETEKHENFITFSKAVNYLVSNHKDEFCSFEPKKQEFYLNQLIKTAQLVFLKNVDYSKIVEQPLDCVLLLGDLFYGDFLYGDLFKDQNKMLHGYFNENCTKRNSILFNIHDHIQKYKELKKELFPGNTITQSATAMLHVLTRISFQGLSKNDCIAINNFIWDDSNENIEQKLISVYQFALFFNHQAFNNSDLIKNTHNKIVKDYFLDWQINFNQNNYFAESIDLAVLFTKKDLLFKNSFVKELFDKYIPPKIIIYDDSSLDMQAFNQTEAEHEKLKQDYLFCTNYLLQAYEKHKKICKRRSINPKQFWQEAEELWSTKEQNSISIDFKNLFSTYADLMINWNLARDSVLNKNTQLPEFAKKYKETCDTLQQLGAGQHIHNEAGELIFINWWTQLYKYNTGDTYPYYTQIKKGLKERATNLHHECQIHYLIETYYHLIKKVAFNLMEYKEGFEFFIGKSPFPEQKVNEMYAYSATKNMHERKGDVSNYFKEKIFTR